MKRFTFTTALLSVSLLAVWMISEASSVSSSKSKIDESSKESASKGMSVPKSAANVKIAPVYDSTGALVSDPSGAIADEDMAVPVTGAEKKVAPVFDTTGTVVSDPSGTIWNASNP